MKIGAWIIATGLPRVSGVAALMPEAGAIPAGQWMIPGFPLVTRIRGDSTGSGSVLTKKCRALMDSYDKFTEAIDQTAQPLYKQMLQDSPELN